MTYTLNDKILAGNPYIMLSGAPATSGGPAAPSRIPISASGLVVQANNGFATPISNIIRFPQNGVYLLQLEVTMSMWFSNVWYGLYGRIFADLQYVPTGLSTQYMPLSYTLMTNVGAGFPASLTSSMCFPCVDNTTSSLSLYMFFQNSSVASINNLRLNLVFLHGL